MDQREHRKRWVSTRGQTRLATEDQDIVVELKYDAKKKKNHFVMQLKATIQLSRSPQRHLWGLADIRQDHIKILKPNTHTDYGQDTHGCREEIITVWQIKTLIQSMNGCQHCCLGKTESRCCCWAQQHSCWEAENSQFTSTTAAFSGCYFY